MNQTRALPIAWVALEALIVINWAGGAAILGLLLSTIFAEQWTFRALGVTPSSGIAATIMGLRAVAALGVIAVPLNDMVLRRLRSIVETVRRGDPFIPANAYRLQAIAWVLLALQILSVVIGAIGNAISTAENPIHLDAGFSPSGWLAVLLTFVLARVFVKGTWMREDLEGTV